MTTFREFQDELERLHQRAETARRKEKGEALERIRALILEYQLSPSELGFASVRKVRAAAGTATHGNHVTGAT